MFMFGMQVRLQRLRVKFVYEGQLVMVEVTGAKSVKYVGLSESMMHLQ